MSISSGATQTVQNLEVGSPNTATPGGGVNSTFAVPLPGGGLLAGASVDVSFTFAVDTRGTFWFGYDVDALAGVDGGARLVNRAQAQLCEPVEAGRL